VKSTYIDHRTDKECVVMLEYGIVRALEANMQLSRFIILNILERLAGERQTPSRISEFNDKLIEINGS
jgi:hypothetical protein